MKTDNIKVLLDNGLQLKTISKLTESQINVLAKKFLKEQAIPQNTTLVPKPPTQSYQVKPNSKTMVNGVEVDTTGGKTIVTPLKELDEDDTINIVQDPDATADGMPTTESELKEKFESKAQQKFFWARCTKSKDKNSKWCKWANEFSDKTKSFKKLPEKLHPDKTVKVRKENYDQFLEDSIVEMVEKYINPSMTKSQFVKSINEKTDKSESFMLKRPKKNSMFSQDKGKEMKTMKRPIGNLYSIGESTKTAPAKPGTKEKEKTKDPGKKNPFQPKHNPAPKAKKEFKEQTTAPVKPGTKEKTREKGPGKKNPFQPKHNPAPKAGKEKLPTFLTWNKLGVNLK